MFPGEGFGKQHAIRLKRMEELERLKSKIRNASELQSIVKIMKAISAANIREYGQASESLMQYNKTIEMGLQIVMLNNPEAFLAMSQRRKRSGSESLSSAQIRGSQVGSMSRSQATLSPG